MAFEMRNCTYDKSSVTANTLFHKMKVSILKSFEAVFLRSVRKKVLFKMPISIKTLLLAVRYSHLHS